MLGGYNYQEPISLNLNGTNVQKFEIYCIIMSMNMLCKFYPTTTWWDHFNNFTTEKPIPFSLFLLKKKGGIDLFSLG